MSGHAGSSVPSDHPHPRAARPGAARPGPPGGGRPTPPAPGDGPGVSGTSEELERYEVRVDGELAALAQQDADGRDAGLASLHSWLTDLLETTRTGGGH